MELSNAYMKKVYDALDMLPVKGTIDLKKIGNQGDREKFVAAVKIYIDDGHPNYEFSNKYDKVIKRNNYQF